MLTGVDRVFQPRVSFDTLDQTADDVDDNSFTLISKHKDYEYTKRSRTFLCGCDDNDYSDYALQWLIDELVDDGDEIVCLRVVEKIDSGAADKNAEHKRYRSEANALMKQFQAKNHENKAINLVLEFAVGKVHKVIDEMVSVSTQNFNIFAHILADQPIRTGDSRSWDKRSRSWRFSGPVARVRFEVLLAKLPSAGHCGPPIIEAR